ncbi:MAG: hypothetical protein ACT4QF_19760 [Sporichthyaceae bacterium]
MAAAVGRRRRSARAPLLTPWRPGSPAATAPLEVVVELVVGLVVLAFVGAALLCLAVIACATLLGKLVRALAAAAASRPVRIPRPRLPRPGRRTEAPT